jgi:hypothetical protein
MTAQTQNTPFFTSCKVEKLGQEFKRSLYQPPLKPPINALPNSPNSPIRTCRNGEPPPSPSSHDSAKSKFNDNAFAIRKPENP